MAATLCQLYRRRNLFPLSLNWLVLLSLFTFCVYIQTHRKEIILVYVLLYCIYLFSHEPNSSPDYSGTFLPTAKFIAERSIITPADLCFTGALPSIPALAFISSDLFSLSRLVCFFCGKPPATHFLPPQAASAARLQMEVTSETIVGS